MALACTVCVHPQRVKVDEALVGGQSVRVVAGQFTLSRSAVQRHAAEHLPKSLAAIRSKREQLSERSLADRLERNIERLDRMLVGATSVRELVGALAEIRKTLELLARLSGELKEASTQIAVVNVATSPDFLRLQDLVLAALAPFPDARLAVAAAIAPLRPAAAVQGRVIEG